MKTKTSQKWLGGIGLFAICLILTGCNAHSHEWQEATCTTPKTCITCNETEGEPLGHTWVEASCSAPKTCSVCGETEGESLEHTLTDANYQQAATCLVCGETVGEPLQADFEKYNLTEHFIELDKEYDCIVACNNDISYNTNAKLVLSNYQKFTSGLPETTGHFTINSELPEEPGYEYKVVEVAINFSDKNAIEYGAAVSPCFEDYYDVIGHDESWKTRDDGWNQFTVNWNEIEYTECIFNYITEWVDNDDQTYTYNAIYIVRIPVGYDGFVLGFRNGQVEWEEGKHINDLDNADTLFFRLK